MGYIKKLKSFLTGKEKNFKQQLINLKKFIDEKCPDEIKSPQGELIINKVEVVDYPSDKNNGYIEIQLIQDDNNLCGIKIKYKNHKFDMITWERYIINDNIFSISKYDIDIDHGVEKSLFDNIVNYLLSVDMIGSVI